MKRMSFALTEAQFLDGSKTVTRRLGWKNIMVGDHFLAIRKGMGLKKGEKQVILGECVVIARRRERLGEICKIEVMQEGFPGMTPWEFVKMFSKHMNCNANQRVTRIKFKRLD